MGATLFWHKVIYFKLIGYFLFKHIFKSLWSMCDFQIHRKPVAVINSSELLPDFRKMKTKNYWDDVLTVTKAWMTHFWYCPFPGRSPFSIMIIKLIAQGVGSHIGSPHNRPGHCSSYISYSLQTKMMVASLNDHVNPHEVHFFQMQVENWAVNRKSSFLDNCVLLFWIKGINKHVHRVEMMSTHTISCCSLGA